MKLFALVDFEDGDIPGVYKTEEAAEKARQELIDNGQDEDSVLVQETKLIED